MELSISTGLYYKKDYREILDIIAASSCSNIELFLNQAFIDVNINDLYKEVSSRKLSIVSIHTPLEFIVFPREESENDWINRCIDMAKAFGSQLIVSHMVMGEYFEDILNGLDELHKQNMLQYKDTREICITTENLTKLGTESFLARYDELFDFVSSNELFMTFDTTHCASVGAPIIETFHKFRPFIKNIHLSDFENGAEHKILGDGSLPLKELLLLLKNEYYDGLITLEYDFDNKIRNDIRDNAQAIAALQRSVDFIYSIME